MMHSVAKRQQNQFKHCRFTHLILFVGLCIDLGWWGCYLYFSNC